MLVGEGPVCGRPAAADRGAVHDVVVQQGEGVQQLEGGDRRSARRRRGPRRWPGGPSGEGGAQPLPPGGDETLHLGRHRGGRGVEVGHLLLADGEERCQGPVDRARGPPPTGSSSAVPSPASTWPAAGTRRSPTGRSSRPSTGGRTGLRVEPGERRDREPGEEVHLRHRPRAEVSGVGTRPGGAGRPTSPTRRRRPRRGGDGARGRPRPPPPGTARARPCRRP